LSGTIPVVEYRGHTNHPIKEVTMQIDWRSDIDALLNEARAAEKPVLLDFNAAPM
jgi:hypothetical protein